jgi:hypothetical protein
VNPGSSLLPLDPDWNRYFDYERADILKIWTARADGSLIGYIELLLAPPLHSQANLCAYGQGFWLAPEWRDGLTGLRFIRSIEAPLRGLKARMIRMATNDLFAPDAAGESRVGVLFRRSGYQRVETVYQKELIP